MGARLQGVILPSQDTLPWTDPWGVPSRAGCVLDPGGGGASTTSSTEVSATWVSIPAVTAGRRPNKQKNQLFIHSVRLLRLS